MEEKMNWNEVFVIRPTGTEEKEFVITIGNRLASDKKFANVKAAQNYINSKPWELIVVLISIFIECKKEKLKDENPDKKVIKP